MRAFAHLQPETTEIGLMTPQSLGVTNFAQVAASTPSLIEALPIAIYTTDAAGRITAYNQAAAAFWVRCPVLGEDRGAARTGSTGRMGRQCRRTNVRWP